MSLGPRMLVHVTWTCGISIQYPKFNKHTRHNALEKCSPSELQLSWALIQIQGCKLPINSFKRNHVNPTGPPKQISPTIKKAWSLFGPSDWMLELQ